ncbi:DUF1573 domain-containing protein [Candidatus Woesearchaeota archaeon]|nr:DUF1573 domain-containing protein [Candidatus Woesearchaeota archaeon]
MTETQEQEDFSQLSKAQRKKLKKERKQQEKEQHRINKERRSRRRKLRNYGVVLLIIIALAGFIYMRSIPPKNAPIIEITPAVYNFGSVSQLGGVVSTELDVRNTGTGDLVLTNMGTSCMCTSASIVSNGEEGPAFGMASHGTNPKNWKHVIPPGESSKLKISYDPNAHPELRGAVTRSVSITSNDPRSRNKEVRINVLQTD